MAASAQKLREINFLKDEPKKNKEFADNTVTTSKVRRFRYHLN